MDISTAVFNAARDGKLKLIQKLLSNKTPEELEALAEGENTGRHTSVDSLPLRAFRGCRLPP
ncbi:unnamed protein product [Tetraodon nigroviridis]|uniref:(spotted green pufferfish) hypothetical protein n=1 Tax=Tetraodon nigroviridis TaxID=99883 RepID=Q4RV16_TETNG|nr:unnamed protein product [Tetraodon nigroviridis]